MKSEKISKLFISMAMPFLFVLIIILYYFDAIVIDEVALIIFLTLPWFVCGILTAKKELQHYNKNYIISKIHFIWTIFWWPLYYKE
jgi:Flp pilus assembly protein TadB